MAEQQNVTLVREAYDAFARGDIAGILAMLDDGVEWEAVHGAGPHVPTAGVRHGKHDVAAFFRTLSETVEFARFEPREFLGQGDRVVVLGRYEGRARPTGRTFTEDWVMVFTVRNGRIRQFREYVSTAAINAAFEAAAV